MRLDLYSRRTTLGTWWRMGERAEGGSRSPTKDTGPAILQEMPMTSATVMAGGAWRRDEFRRYKR